MSFIDERLPMEVEIGAMRREMEDLRIVRTDSGHEVRNARQAQGWFEYDISFPTGEFDSATIAAVKRMFKASRGGLYAFRFRDWDSENNTLTDEVIGTGDGSDTTFQITHSWTAGGETYTRNITRPVSAITVKLDGVTQVGGYSVSYSTGIITFTPAVSNGVEVSVSGTYDIPVRFDRSLESQAPTGWLEHIEGITLIEVRE
jgi:uncharacterized protein (TIGR02217 family)